MHRFALASVLMFVQACTLDFDGVGPKGSGGGLSDGGNGGSSGPGGTSNAGGENSGGSGGGEPVGGAPPTCDAGFCVDIPADFTPAFRPSTVNDCAAAPVVIEGGHADVNGLVFDSPPANCGCLCDPAADLGCSDVEVWVYSQSACANTAEVHFLTEDLCDTVTAGSLRVQSFSPDPAAACEATVTPGASAPTGPFRLPVFGCGVEVDTGSCETGACVPNGSCIVSETATSCPPGFVQREPIFTSADTIDDQRGCACSCPSGSGTCGLNVAFFTGNACQPGGIINYATSEGACSTATIGSMMYLPTFNGVCGAPMTEYVGDVLVTTDRIVCCLP